MVELDTSANRHQLGNFHFSVAAGRKDIAAGEATDINRVLVQLVIADVKTKLQLAVIILRNEVA